MYSFFRFFWTLLVVVALSAPGYATPSTGQNNETGLSATFDAAHFSDSELRILQIALLFEGALETPTDTPWSVQAQSALELYSRNNHSSMPLNVHAATLAITLLSAVEDQNWTLETLGNLDIKMALPGAVLSEPIAEDEGLRWWSTNGTLTMLTHQFDTLRTSAWHDAAIKAVGDKAILLNTRGDGQLATGGHLPDGRIFYTYSEQKNDKWSTVFLASGPDEVHLLNVMRASLLLQGTEGLGVPEDGNLALYVDQMLDLLDEEILGQVEIPEGPTDNGQRVDASGTGFYINPRTMVTAAHVVNSCSSVTLKDGTPLDVLAQDETLDMAVLVAPVTSDYWLTLSPQERSRLGQSVHAAGFPYYKIAGTSLHLTGGNVSSLADVNDDRRFFSFTAPVQPGNSGGPLLGRNGTVVGIVVSRLSEQYIADATGTLPQNINYALNSSEVIGFLNAQNVKIGGGSIGPFELGDGAPAGFERAVVPVICH